MNLHLAEISKQVAAGAHAVLLLDGAGYHQKAALELPQNITLLPLLSYSPELNPAENNSAYLRGNKLANTVYETYDDIVDKACEAWMFFARKKQAARCASDHGFHSQRVSGSRWQTNDKERVASIATREWAKVSD